MAQKTNITDEAYWADLEARFFDGQTTEDEEAELQRHLAERLACRNNGNLNEGVLNNSETGRRSRSTLAVMSYAAMSRKMSRQKGRQESRFMPKAAQAAATQPAIALPAKPPRSFAFYALRAAAVAVLLVGAGTIIRQMIVSNNFATEAYVADGSNRVYSAPMAQEQMTQALSFMAADFPSVEDELGFMLGD